MAHPGELLQVTTTYVLLCLILAVLVWVAVKQFYGRL